MRKPKRLSLGHAHASITIKDIAAHLGIADSTVSRALSDHPYTNRGTKERVRRAVEKFGYVPHLAARSLRNSRGVLVGLILPNIDSQAFATAAQILSHRCESAGLQMVLAISGDDPEIEYRHVQALRGARAVGIVITPCGVPHEKTLALLQSIPTVQYARHHPRLAAPGVSVDSERGMTLATQHLLDLGHRRIAYLGPHLEISTGAERLAGFLRAHKQFNVTADPTLIIAGTLDANKAATSLAALLATRLRPTAVVVAADVFMLGALAALRDADLELPRDVSLVGYGNPGWYGLWRPGLTTIEQPFLQMADTAASQLLAQLAAPATSRLDPEQRRLETKFIVRGSTAPPTHMIETRRKSGT